LRSNHDRAPASQSGRNRAQSPRGQREYSRVCGLPQRHAGDGSQLGRDILTCLRLFGSELWIASLQPVSERAERLAATAQGTQPLRSPGPISSAPLTMQLRWYRSALAPVQRPFGRPEGSHSETGQASGASVCRPRILPMRQGDVGPIQHAEVCLLGVRRSGVTGLLPARARLGRISLSGESPLSCPESGLRAAGTRRRLRSCG
jgi:hypothetical protein